MRGVCVWARGGGEMLAGRTARLTTGGTPAAYVLFDYSYVSNESNIYRKTFDHRSGDPYNES